MSRNQKISFDRLITSLSLSDDELLWLIGVSCWVFNSNLHFIIELLDKEHHSQSDVSWLDFINLTAGRIQDYRNLIKKRLGLEIYNLFSEIVNRRNAIFHSFPSGEKHDGYYVSYYRDKNSSSTAIDKEYLEKFIKKNDRLSELLEEHRKKL